MGHSLQHNLWQNTHSYTIFISAGHSLQPSPWQNTATPSLSQRGTHYSPAPDKTQLHHLYLSGALTTAQPLTKHSYTIFISAGHSLQPSPWQNTATPSLSQRGTHYSPAPDKTQLHHLYLSGALTTAQPLTKHSYTIFISAGHSLQPSPWQNTATPSLSQRGTHYSPTPDKTQLHHTLIFIPAGHPVQRNTHQNTHLHHLHPSRTLTTAQTPTKHTATQDTDLHQGRALTTVQSPTKHTQLHHSSYTDHHPSRVLSTG